MTFEAMIEAMSPEQRYAAMQLLWEKLSDTPEAIAPPEWHGDLLAERTAKYENGDAKLVELEDAKKRLQGRFD